MDIALIVFDMAGTTVQDDDAVNLSLHAALAEAHVDASREAINAVMGMPKPQAIQRLLAEYRGQRAATDAEVAAVHTRFSDLMLAHYTSGAGVRECDGATAMFEWCRAMGIKATLDTGFNRPIADAIIHRLGWKRAGLLDATVTSDEVARGRPFPDMIYRLMALTGVAEPARVVKVGDTPVDIAQGHAAGCRLVVGVTSGSHSAAELEPHGPTDLVATLDELRELVGRASTEAA